MGRGCPGPSLLDGQCYLVKASADCSTAVIEGCGDNRDNGLRGDEPD